MTKPARPKFGVVVLTMGKRPDDLDRGLVSLLNQRDVDLDVVVVGNGWRPTGLPDGVKARPLPENLGSTMMPVSRRTTSCRGWQPSSLPIRRSA